MDEHIASVIETMDEDDREGIEALLSAAPDDLHLLSAYAYSLMGRRRALAFRVYRWLAKRPAPTDPPLREEWLRIQNNACYLAVFHGEPEERRAVVDRAIVVAADNIAIYHNAACVLCDLGEPDLALAAIREAIARGIDDASIRSMAEDEDLDLIRHTEAFRAVIAGRGAYTIPSWAKGWTAWEVVQLRALVRTTLPHPDMTHFDEGRVESAGKVLDVAAIAAECTGLPVTEWDEKVSRRVRALLDL